MATRAQITVNGVAGSNDDVTLNALVQLNNNGLGDETTFEWTLISQPSGSPNATLSSGAIQAPTFTPNKEGSYLIELVVNKNLPDQKIDRVIVAVRELETRNRIPAAGETSENNAATGWANTAVDEIFQRVTRFTDSGVRVGTAGEAGLLPLDVVYAADVTTIATGLPGQREVPVWKRALATTGTMVRGQLGVLLAGVDGSPAPAENALLRVGILTLVKSVPLGTPGWPAGTPIYVNDLGRISLEPGTIVRQIGTVLDDMGGGDYGVWITGEGSFGTLQSVSVNQPLEIVGAGGVSPVISLGYGDDFALGMGALVLSEPGVVAGTYGEAAPAYPATPASLLPSFTVDSKGRLTAASQAGITIGGLAAKTYVDNGDAATLASANAYTDAKSYGLSSKVPVHVATTTALPANTANGSFQTLTANVHGPLGDIDGHTLLVGERILVKNEAAQANNGIYVLTQAGSTSGPSQPWIMTRAEDANTAAELCGSLVTVNVGTSNAGTAWLFAYNPSLFVLGTTPVVFTQLNAQPATTTVLGTVQLAGALGGAGTLATAPVVALGTGYVSGVLPAANGGTGLSSPGASGNVLVSNGTSWTSAGLPEAQAAVTGGVRLAGGLGGSGSTALIPKLNMDHASSGTLPYSYGGTGLTSSGLIAGAVLASNGTNSWQVVAEYSDCILQGVITKPQALRAVAVGGSDVLFISTRPGSVSPTFRLQLPEDQNSEVHTGMSGANGTNLQINASSGNTGGNIEITGGGSYTVSGGVSTGGFVTVAAGDLGQASGKAPSATVRGGVTSNISATSRTGGDAILVGGECTASTATPAGTGGNAIVRGGSTGTSFGNGGDVLIEGGTATGTSGIGGDVTIYGGGGGSGGPAGSVYISRRPGATTGKVQITDAYINGTGTSGQVLVSRGASLPPEWQPLGGISGPASYGRIRVVSVIQQLQVDDFAVFAAGNVTNVTLPDADLITPGRIFIIKNRNADSTLTVYADTGQEIDGATSIVLAAGDVLRVMRTTGGSNQWMKI